LVQLEVHGLHDEAHAALAEHALDAVSAREHGADLDSAGLHHARRASPHAAAALIPEANTRLRIMHSHP
jgi:hypothetical protein